MQSVFAKALLGVCAAALMCAGALSQTADESAAQPSEQAAPAGEPQPPVESEQPQDTAGDDAAAAGSAAEDLSADTVVATVAGTPILLGELVAARRGLPAEFQQLPDEVLMQALVEQLANQLLLAQAAREAGLDQTPAVQFTLKNQERSVLAGAYMEQEIAERLSDASIEAAYQESYAGGEPVEEAHAAHILVEDEATAQEIREKLDEGADFAALAAEHGTDGTASRGGDLGWFTHERMVPPFADAVFAMEPDTVSGPVETPFGWHVIKLFEKRQRPVPPLDSVRDQIAADLAQTVETQVLGDIREGVDVQVDSAAVPPSAIRADEILSE